jgi:anti-anti-sigma factor
MTTSLTLSTARNSEGQPILVAVGEIDMSNIDAFSSALASALAESPDGRRLMVDLSAVEYLDSAAVNVMFASADQIHLIANPLLIPALSVSGLTELATIEPAPTTAL